LTLGLNSGISHTGGSIFSNKTLNIWKFHLIVMD